MGKHKEYYSKKSLWAATLKRTMLLSFIGFLLDFPSFNRRSFGWFKKKKKKYTWENELPARNISCSACAARLISCPVLCQLHKLKTIPSIPIPPSTHKTFGMFEESFSLRLCLQKLFSSAKFTGNFFSAEILLKGTAHLSQQFVCLWHCILPHESE